MELDHYLESVRRSVENATALADEQTRSVAQRLGATLDDAGRLALISALSDAAGEISRELSPGSVELRMAGGRPEFVVTPAPSQLTLSRLTLSQLTLSQLTLCRARPSRARPKLPSRTT